MKDRLQLFLRSGFLRFSLEKEARVVCTFYKGGTYPFRWCGLLRRTLGNVYGNGDTRQAVEGIAEVNVMVWIFRGCCEG